jgi:hypothetical protein
MPDKCAYNVTLRRVRVTIVVVEKPYVLRILSVSVTLVTQHAKRMRCIVLLSGLSDCTSFSHIIS